MFRKSLLAAGIITALLSTSAFGQSVILRGESAAGVYQNLATSPVNTQVLRTTTYGVDPCLSSDVVKSSVAVGITTAATTQLVALQAAQTIYVCGFALTISQVATTANTFKFVQGTGASCGTGTADLTGLFGAGGITAAAPIFVESRGNGTIFKTASGSALCATTAIGASGSFQGVLTYVQQ